MREVESVEAKKKMGVFWPSSNYGKDIAPEDVYYHMEGKKHQGDRALELEGLPRRMHGLGGRFSARSSEGDQRVQLELCPSRWTR
jgi:hypothetical protein